MHCEHGFCRPTDDGQPPMTLRYASTAIWATTREAVGTHHWVFERLGHRRSERPRALPYVGAPQRYPAGGSLCRNADAGGRIALCT